VYGSGDRDKGVGYKILNWQVENSSVRGKSSGSLVKPHLAPLSSVSLSDGQVENTSVRGKWSGGFKHVGFWSTDHGLQVHPSPT